MENIKVWVNLKGLAPNPKSFDAWERSQYSQMKWYSMSLTGIYDDITLINENS
jgi:hypothetical protein